tara:strand:+ start:139291 stop:140421 length:1131 start_codon:yes stop_codon:yes gene_type:complete
MARLATIIFTGFIAFTLFGCSEPKQDPALQFESSISGYFDNIPGASITLAKQTPEGIIPIDTVTVAENGYFLFSTEMGDISVYRIMTGSNDYLTVAVEKGDHVVLEADGNNLYDNYYVGESFESELIKIVVDETMQLAKVSDSVQTEIKHQQAAKNSKALYDSFEFQKAMYANYHDFSVNFINQYPGSIAAYFVAIGLQMDEDPESYKLVLEHLSKEHPKFNFLPTLQDKVGIMLLATVGSIAPELNFESPKGEMISLSSLRGQYVLVDFWASWCKPCRMENPHVLDLYNKYKSKGFEIYGYSLDEKHENWVNAIEEDGINWIHTSDLLGWQAEGSLTYGVQSIPATFLINPEGEIIARNLSRMELETKLIEIYGE